MNPFSKNKVYVSLILALASLFLSGKATKSRSIPSAIYIAHIGSCVLLTSQNEVIMFTTTFVGTEQASILTNAGGHNYLWADYNCGTIPVYFYLSN